MPKPLPTPTSYDVHLTIELKEGKTFKQFLGELNKLKLKTADVLSSAATSKDEPIPPTPSNPEEV
jgi:hypothetical protein